MGLVFAGHHVVGSKNKDPSYYSMMGFGKKDPQHMDLEIDRCGHLDANQQHLYSLGDHAYLSSFHPLRHHGVVLTEEMQH